MKILVLATRNPFPPESGRSKTLADYCWYISCILGHEVLLATLKDMDERQNDVPPFIAKFIKIKPTFWFYRFLCVLLKSFILNSQPLQVALYDCLFVRRQVQKLIEEEKPGIVIADMVRMGSLCVEISVPVILDLDDLLSRRYEQQLNLGILDNIFGKLKSRLPWPIPYIAQNKFFQRLILSKEVNLLKEYEVKLSSIFNAIVLVSPVEAEMLQKKVSKKCFVIPPSLDVNKFLTFNKNAKDEVTVPRIGFVGAMDVAHNEISVLWFCKLVLPLLKKELSNFKFLIIGANPTPRIKKLAEDPNVIITGNVENVYEHILRCDVMVAPLIFGSGIKIKVLESMACGIPVVLTNVAAEGIGAEDGKHFILANDPENFCSAIVNLIFNRELREKISAEGRKFVIKKYAHERVLTTWKYLLEYVNNQN